jgi:predicted glycosyltransferase
MRKTKRTKRTQRRTPLLDDDELGDDDFLAINNPIITSTPTGVQPSVTDDMPKGLQKMMEPTMRHMHSTLKYAAATLLI